MRAGGDGAEAGREAREGGWAGRSTIQSWRSKGAVYLRVEDQKRQIRSREHGTWPAHPMKDFHLARGLICFGFPTKLTSLHPVSSPGPSPIASRSQSRTCCQTRSLTALWIGTTMSMSCARGLRCFRSSAV